MALFTRRNLVKHSTVFELIRDSAKENDSLVHVHPNVGHRKNVIGTIRSFMHISKSPSCRLHGQYVIAQVDMSPGDELTYDPKQTIY